MELPDDALLCPITLALFRDPVVAEDGHTYERTDIEEWIQKNGTSPITRGPISLEHLVPNYTIKKIIDRFENSSREKKYQYTLDVDVKKKKGRPLFQTFGKTIYYAEWLPTNEGRPDVVLLKIDGARANKEASFYVNLSRHPHIVRTFGIVHDGDGVENSIMLLQECASEGNLYELLSERKKPLDEKVLLQIFLQIIDAMNYLALNNVVHGDLACRNVLVFRFDEQDARNIVVKVADFGLSRHSKMYTQVASVARTALNDFPVRYSAPEILSANVTANDCTEKSDIYAMGVLMWEAYSRGAVPWANIETDNGVIGRVRNGEMLPQPTNCSPKYWNVITKTWNQLPSQRPTFGELKKLFIDQLYQTTMSAAESSKPSSKPSSETERPSHQEPTAMPTTCDSSDITETPNRTDIPKTNANHIHVQSRYQASTPANKPQDSSGPKEIQELPVKGTNVPPLDRPVLGVNKGIEGDSNSEHMDSTIFCMFAYSKVFDSLLHMNVGRKPSVQQLQIFLRENIVNVLRSDTGFVERDALFHLRALLSEATNDSSFKEMEKDPSEFLRALEDLFHYSPLKTISPDQLPNAALSNVTTNIMWEMFDANPHKFSSTSIASIFRNSLAEIPAKLATIPPFLILVAPRHARSQRSYRYITPDRQITLDQNILQLVCLGCQQTNRNADPSRELYFCKECYRNEQTASSSTAAPSDITAKCYCYGCLEKLHKRLSREKLIEHHPKQMKAATYKLNLFAVLCIEVSHYVAFVKCHKRDGQEEWLFFDSMSDRIHNEKNIPCVSPVRDFNRWIEEAENDKYFFEDIDRRRNSGKPISQAFNEDQLRQLRLFRDGAFFFYENVEACCQ